MTLDSSFRFADRISKRASQPEAGEVSKVRRVKDSSYWGAPVGTPITPALKAAKKARSAAKGGKGGDDNGGKGGGKAPAKNPSTPSGEKNDSLKTVGSKTVRDHLAEFQRKIEAAKKENDLVPLVDEAENDSVLDDKDYNRVLDAIEHRLDVLDGKPRDPKKADLIPEEDKNQKDQDHGELRGQDGKPILPPKPKKEAAKKPEGPVTRAHRELGWDKKSEAKGPIGRAKERQQEKKRQEDEAALKEQAENMTPDQKTGGGKFEANKQRFLDRVARAKNADDLKKVAAEARKANEDMEITPRALRQINGAVEGKRAEFAARPAGPETRAYNRIAEAKGTIDVAAALGSAEDARRRGELDSGRAKGVKAEAKARVNEIREDRVIQRILNQIRVAEDEDDLRFIQNNARGVGLKGDARKRAARILNPAFKARKAEIRDEAARAQARQIRPTAGAEPPEAPGKAKARDMQRRINVAAKTADMGPVFDDLNRLADDSDLSYDAYNELADLADAKMDELSKAKNAGPFKVLDAHFKGGKGSIADAPQDGLFEYVEQSDRFDVKPFKKNGNVSDSYRVVDTKTGEVFFAKDHGGGADGTGKEALAGAIGNALGFFSHRVRLGQKADRDGGNMVFIEAAVGKDDELHGLGQLAHARDIVAAGMGKGPSPEGVMGMVLYDYLIDNIEDRHHMNMHVAKNKDGWRPVIIDHGRAFGGYASRLEPAKRNRDFTDWYADYVEASARGWSPHRTMLMAYGDNNSIYEQNFDQIIQRISNAGQIEDIVDAAIRQSGIDGANNEEDVQKYRELLRARIRRLIDPGKRDDTIRALRSTRSKIWG